MSDVKQITDDALAAYLETDGDEYEREAARRLRLKSGVSELVESARILADNFELLRYWTGERWCCRLCDGNSAPGQGQHADTCPVARVRAAIEQQAQVAMSEAEG